jgi:hypothetical protein
MKTQDRKYSTLTSYFIIYPSLRRFTKATSKFSVQLAITENVTEAMKHDITFSGKYLEISGLFTMILFFYCENKNAHIQPGS